MKSYKVGFFLAVALLFFPWEARSADILADTADEVGSVLGAKALGDFDEQVNINGVAGVLKHYRNEQGLDDIPGSLKKLLPPKGWKDETTPGLVMPRYFKDGVYAYILCEDLKNFYAHLISRSLSPLYCFFRTHNTPPGLAQNDFFVLTTVKPIEICKLLGWTNYEVTGADPEDVPRYPGTIRKTSIERVTRGGGIYIYESHDSLANIRSFYCFKMNSYGWSLADEGKFDESYLEEKFGLSFQDTNSSQKMPEGFFLTFTRDGKTVNVLMNEKETLDSSLITVYY